MQKYYLKLKPGESAALGAFIARHLDVNKETAEELLAWGSVWNNDTKQRLKDPAFLVTGETIVINKPLYPIKPYPFRQEDIIYSDPYFYVIYKQPFFPTVSTPYSDINSLLYGLDLFHRNRGEQGNVLVINRLDLSARGLVLFARDKKTAARLHELFKNREIKKYYLAKTERFAGVRRRYVMEDVLEHKGKEQQAKTIACLLKTTERFCYFLVIPKTGRMHQIRKHFAANIRPLFGDPNYGDYSRYEHMGLICFCYLFRHPITKQRIKIQYLPADFAGADCETYNFHANSRS